MAEAETHEVSQEPDVDFDMIKAALQQLKDRFMDERVAGFVHPNTGQQIPPVSRQEAEQRWQKASQQFATMLLKFRNDASTSRKLGVGDKPGGSAGGRPTRLARSTYTGGADFESPETDWADLEKGWERGKNPAAAAMADEPSLRRGESLVARIVGKKLYESDIAQNPDYEHDQQMIQAALEQIHQRFVEERVAGYTDPRTGQVYPPASPQEVEERWLAVAPKFQRVLSHPSPDTASSMQKKLGIRNPGSPELHYSHPEAQ